MEQTLNLTINRLPALTWHHLGMNQTSLEQVLAEGEGTLTIETPDGVTQPAQDDLLQCFRRDRCQPARPGQADLRPGGQKNQCLHHPRRGREPGHGPHGLRR